MKKNFKLLGMAFLAGVAVTLIHPITAKAATRMITYDYVSDAWYSSIDDGQVWTAGLDGVESAFQDGDTLVINGDNRPGLSLLTVNLNARIGELAVTGGATASVTAKGVDIAYATGLDKSTLILYSDVTTALSLPDSTLQVMGNVTAVQATYEVGKRNNIGISGTVGSMNVYWGDIWTQKTIYNIAEGKLELDEENFLLTDSQYYSLTPVASVPAVPDTTTAQQQTPAAAQQQTTAAAPQLDKVPKTGYDLNLPAIFFSLAAVFAVGGAVLTVQRTSGAKIKKNEEN